MHAARLYGFVIMHDMPSSVEMQAYLYLRDQILLRQIEFFSHLYPIFFQNLFAAGINDLAD